MHPGQALGTDRPEFATSPGLCKVSVAARQASAPHLTLEQLLRSPRFHRGVELVEKQMYQIKHGRPPEETGGTNIEKPDKGDSLLGQFIEELQNQIKGGPPKR